MKVIMRAGIEVKAVVISYEYRFRVKSIYNYAFCFENMAYYGSFGENIEYGDFLYGDSITIKFNPKNPKKNYPIIIHCKRNTTIMNKYYREFPKNKMRDIYKLGMWKGWTYDDRLDKFIKTYPVLKEAFPCLPPQYYGEF
jgi:hypothetical protein